MSAKLTYRSKYADGVLESAIILYFILYIVEVPFIKRWLNDMSVTNCLLTMALFESFFRLKLIQTNSHYEELFKNSSIPVCIVDETYTELCCSKAYKEIPISEMCKSETSPVITEKNMYISSAPIKIGHVLWEEDFIELMGQIRSLADTRERLEVSNAVATEEYRTRFTQHQIIEQNRMYDMMQSHTEHQIWELQTVVESLSNETRPSAEKKMLLKLGVLGSYIKRRNNLIFLSEN